MTQAPSVDALVQAAVEIRERAYAPYSNYHVGAAVGTQAGAIICGVNVENASYPLTVCAERVALGSYIAQGGGTISAIVVATRDAGSPCGACRQVIAEFAAPDCPIIAVDEQGKRRQWTAQELLPDSFSLRTSPDKT